MRGLTLVLLGALACAGCGSSKPRLLTLRSSPEHRVFRIVSASMEPTLHCARPQPLCTGRRATLVEVVPVAPADVRRGDIVAYRVPSAARRRCGIAAGGVVVHRVVGLPGETWSESDGVVSIDGRRLDEPYVAPSRRDHGSNAPVPDGDGFFVMGDNRNYSCDSRVWGPLAARALVGRVRRAGEKVG